MNALLLRLFIFVVQLSVIFSELPPIDKCKLSDAACLKNSAQCAVPVFAGGIPEIGVEPVDPMKVDLIKIYLAGLNLDIDNVVVKGLKKAEIDTVSVDMAKKEMKVSWDSNITMKGHYVASGRLIILPISGDGEYNMKIKKLFIQLTMNFDISKNENGKDFIDLKNYKYTFQIKENMHFALTNLFNGNKGLSDAMLNFMNSNWKLLANEFGDSMLEQPAKKLFTAMQTYFKSQPLEDISLN